MAVIQDLPQELLDRIIELAADGRNSSDQERSWERRLSLVAKSWTEAGQRLTHGLVQISTQTDFKRLTRCITDRSKRTDRPIRLGRILLCLTDDLDSELRELSQSRIVEVDNLSLLYYRGTLFWDLLCLISEFVSTLLPRVKQVR